MGTIAERREWLDSEERILKKEGAVWSLRGVAQLPADPKEKAYRPAPFCWSLEREANCEWAPCPPGAKGSCPAWNQGCVQGSRRTGVLLSVYGKPCPPGIPWHSVPERDRERDLRQHIPLRSHSASLMLSMEGPASRRPPGRGQAENEVAKERRGLRHAQE